MNTKQMRILLVVSSTLLLPASSWGQPPANAADPLAHSRELRTDFERKIETLRQQVTALARRPRDVAAVRASLLRCVNSMKAVGRQAITAEASRDTMAAFGTGAPLRDLESVVTEAVNSRRAPLCSRRQALTVTTLAGLFGHVPAGVQVPSPNDPSLSAEDRTLATSLAGAARAAPEHDMVFSLEETQAVPETRLLAAEPPQLAPLVASVRPTVLALDEIVSAYPVERRPANPSLTLEESRDLFPALEIAYRGAPRFNASLFGRVYQRCRAAFQVENSTQSVDGHRVMGHDSSGTEFSGFRILDPTGSGRACIQSIRGNGSTQCEANEVLSDGELNPRYCVSLKTIPGAEADFRTVPSGKIGLLYIDPNSDRNGEAAVALSDQQHVNQADLLAERAERSRAARKAEIERLSAVSRCRGSEANLSKATNAVRDLAHMNATEVRSIIPGFNPTKMLQEIERARLDAYGKRIARADMDDLATIREELTAHLENHPDDANKIRSHYERIANRYLALAPKNPEALDEARASVDELAGTGAYEGRALERLTGVSWQLQMLQMQQQASRGVQNNNGFWTNWQQLYQQTYENYFSACYGGNTSSWGPFSVSSYGGNNSDISLEGCTNSQQRMQQVGMLPGVAQQAEQRRVNMQMQMQQQMATALYGNTGGGGIGAWAGGQFGQQGGAPGAGPSMVPNLPTLPLSSGSGSAPGIRL